MNKKEAASFLLVSTKAIERYVARGKLHVTYQRKARGGREAVYKDEEVQALKEEMAQPIRAIARTGRRDTATRQDASIVSAPNLAVAINQLAAKIEASQPNGRTPALTDLAVKLTLSLGEAAALSGLPADALEKAIRKGRLKTFKADGETRVKRTNLKKFINHL